MNFGDSNDKTPGLCPRGGKLDIDELSKLIAPAEKKAGGPVDPEGPQFTRLVNLIRVGPVRSLPSSQAGKLGRDTVKRD